ncbi:MAG: LuxR C-terminal-related transcriptional regulator [Sterolibacterium sp.]|jgi:ATP/maltotriose-dependent transcriptional regulator MalT
MAFRKNYRQSQDRKYQPIVHIDDAVWRERLISKVLSAPPSKARLTIVTAPAGFGKTTVLAQLARHTESSGAKIAWLNCDARDRDPEIFSESLLSALANSKLSPKKKGGAMVSHVAAHIASITEPLVIFIDEYETASTAQVDDVIDAIAATAPANVSVVLASRELPNLPLTQLQLAGLIRLVDADFLRFSDDETRSLLRDCMPEKAVHQVAAYADGWPFALQLARLRAAGGIQEEWMVDSRAKMPRRQIFDYLAEEVFSTLKDETIAFLSEVATLETLDVASANAVRQRDDSLAFIQELTALKPIVVVDESNWSARLHPLLRDYLIDSMEVATPGKRAVLHLRAAQHLAERQRIYEAVEHAVAGGRLDEAARMIEEAGAILLLVSEGGLRVRALLQQLPAATILRHPRLQILQYGCQVALGLITGDEFRRIERRIAEADANQDDPAQVDLELARTFMLVVESEETLQFSPWSVLANAKQLARHKFADDDRALIMCLAVEITLLQRYGPVDRCERRTAEIERIYNKYDFQTRPWLWMYHARTAYAQGDLDKVERIIQESLLQDEDFPNYQPQFLGQIITVLIGKVHFQRGNVEQALAQFASIMPAESFNMCEIQVGGMVDPAICESAMGNPARAIEMLSTTRQYAFEENVPHLGVAAAATQIEIEVTYGDYRKAVELAESIKLDELWQTAKVPFALPWIEVEAIARSCFFLRVHDREYQAALNIADMLWILSTTTGYQLTGMGALVMRAMSLQLLGRDEASSQDLQRALLHAKRFGLVQIFLGFGAELMVQIRALGDKNLGAASEWARHVVKTWESTFRIRSGASSAFTPRELDVLCELTKEKTTKMIAKTLMLSPETVKQHLKAIFSKLGVGKREDAVAEARRRALMP